MYGYYVRVIFMRCLFGSVHVAFTCLRIVEVVVDLSWNEQERRCFDAHHSSGVTFLNPHKDGLPIHSTLQEVRLYSAHCGVRLPAGCVFQHQGEQAEHDRTASFGHLSHICIDCIDISTSIRTISSAAIRVDILNYYMFFWCNTCISLASMMSNTSQDLARPFTDQERMGSSTQELHLAFRYLGGNFKMSWIKEGIFMFHQAYNSTRVLNELGWGMEQGIYLGSA